MPISYRPILIFTLLLFILLISQSSAATWVGTHANVDLTPTSTDFNAGEKVSSNNTISWWANENWIMTVMSLDPNLGQSDDLSYTKPLSDLMWQLTVGGSWASMTTSGVTVKTGVAGSGSFGMDYKFLLSWAADKPGTYTATIQYTISSN